MWLAKSTYGAVVQLSAKRKARLYDFSLRWHAGWNEALDNALSRLPANNGSDRDVFRILAEPVPGTTKKFGVVSKADQVVAIVGLRRAASKWQLLNSYIMPGMPFPVRDPKLVAPVLQAIGAELDVALWRAGEPPDTSCGWVHDLKAIDTFGMALTDDFEAYWRASGNLSFVRKSRKGCRDMTIVVDAPEAIDWILRNSDAKWSASSATASPDLEDRIRTYRGLALKGRAHTITLHDAYGMIAGDMLVEHHGAIVSVATYRTPIHRKAGTGTYVLDSVFRWARERGYRTIDLGGGYAYKRLWAPVNGQKYEFRVGPPLAVGMKSMVKYALKGRQPTGVHALEPMHPVIYAIDPLIR